MITSDKYSINRVEKRCIENSDLAIAYDRIKNSFNTNKDGQNLLGDNLIQKKLSLTKKPRWQAI